MASPTLPPLLGISRVLLEDALGNLRLRFSRSLLALIGIGVGTAAVIAMLHIGHDARAEAMREFDEIGADFATITPPIAGPVLVSEQDVADLPSAQTGLVQAAPLIMGTGMVIERNDRIASMLVGTSGELAPLLHLQLAHGRFVSSLDGKMPFVVIGADLARRIETASARPLAVGDQIRLDGTLLTVVGILAQHASNPLLGVDLNQSVVVPLMATVRLVRSPTINLIVARMAPHASETAVVPAITTFFQKRFRGGLAQVRVASALIADIDQQMSIYGRLLLAIGIVSMSMGGIGIMNVMLMSVMERREEIGLRAAIGASPQTIMVMFLMESVFLSAAGAAGGTLLGIAAGWLFAWRSGWAFEIAPMSLPLGAGMALVMGLLFGLYPAWRAASLQPIEALRRG